MLPINLWFCSLIMPEKKSGGFSKLLILLDLIYATTLFLTYFVQQEKKLCWLLNDHKVIFKNISMSFLMVALHWMILLFRSWVLCFLKVVYLLLVMQYIIDVDTIRRNRHNDDGKFVTYYAEIIIHEKEYNSL